MFKNIITRWFLSRDENIDSLDLEQAKFNRSKRLPHEIYYFPDQITDTDLESENLTDDINLIGTPIRIDIAETEEIKLSNVPDDFKSRIYKEKQFEIGISDGYHGIPPKFNLNILESIQSIEKTLSYPLRIKEKIALYKAKKRMFEVELNNRNNKLNEIDKTKNDIENELKSLRKLYNDIEAENFQTEVNLKKKELERLINEEDDRIEQNSQEKLKQNQSIKHSNIVTFISGLLLTISACFFVMADIALSISAIYALGFKDKNSLKWGDVIFDTSKWDTHWEGISICLAIAFITFFFKYIYDFFRDEKLSLSKKQKYVMVPIGLICVVTIFVLAILRAEFLVNNALENKLFLGVHPMLAKVSFILPTISFPFIGAILLSEGLHKIFTTFSKLYKVPYTKISSIRNWSKITNVDFQPGTLKEKIIEKEEKKTEITEKLEEVKDIIVKIQARIEQIDQHIPLWNDAIDSYNERLLAIPGMDNSIYLHGYELGKTFKAKSGPYRLLVEKMSQQLHRSP